MREYRSVCEKNRCPFGFLLASLVGGSTGQRFTSSSLAGFNSASCQIDKGATVWRTFDDDVDLFYSIVINATSLRCIEIAASAVIDPT